MGDSQLAREVLEAIEEEEALEKLVELLRNLGRSGLLDVLVAASDPEVVSRLYKLVVSTGLLRLLDRLPELSKLLDELVRALEEPVEPVSLMGFLRRLRDPEVGRGLARLLELLRILGRGL